MDEAKAREEEIGKAYVLVFPDCSYSGNLMRRRES
jgi:hypothetical protein